MLFVLFCSLLIERIRSLVMSRNPSYGSSASAKPRCPHCGNIIALTVESCPQCGFRGFFKAGQRVKETCHHCDGNGMAPWYAPPNLDYCEACSGRGFCFKYDVIDLRDNETLPQKIVYDYGDPISHLPPYPGLRENVQGVPPVKIVHRGRAPRPVSRPVPI